MIACNASLEPVYDNECLGDSVPKINNNFLTLQTILSGLRQRTDDRIEVRTFFYYGPNSSAPGAAGRLTSPGKGAGNSIINQNSPAASGMDDNQTTRPSNLTIEAFVNSPTQLNLSQISQPGDIAYVIYQKTGFLSSILQNAIVASQQNPVYSSYQNVYGKKGQLVGTIPRALLTPAGKGGYNVNAQWITTDDIVMQLSPVFIIWRLTCSNQLAYIVDQGFPKFHRAQTTNTILWNQPQLWNQFTEYV
jgi:hypothetical protein